MIDQTKFNEHVQSLLVLTEIIATADSEAEALEYMERLLAAAVAEMKLEVKQSG